ncbi:hypothetical protein F511_37000 [Dorcoceras hygrometricum]|uniref:Uncharacterized protein n=1 Tax=Dorcoceras hygrometricum TaxID=472368 RepID=A0A2Z7AX25_9LAMI|nr:hypothetical protein F511_37000 [Dorcoceras hygrometricum]
MSGTKNIGNNRRAKRIGSNNCDTSPSLVTATEDWEQLNQHPPASTTEDWEQLIQHPPTALNRGYATPHRTTREELQQRNISWLTWNHWLNMLCRCSNMLNMMHLAAIEIGTQEESSATLLVPNDDGKRRKSTEIGYGEQWQQISTSYPCAKEQSYKPEFSAFTLTTHSNQNDSVSKVPANKNQNDAASVKQISAPTIGTNNARQNRSTQSVDICSRNLAANRSLNALRTSLALDPKWCRLHLSNDVASLPRYNRSHICYHSLTRVDIRFTTNLISSPIETNEPGKDVV